MLTAMRNGPHNCLPTLIHMHVLNSHRLLSFAVVLVERGDEVRFGAMFKFALADP